MKALQGCPFMCPLLDQVEVDTARRGLVMPFYSAGVTDVIEAFWKSPGRSEEVCHLTLFPFTLADIPPGLCHSRVGHSCRFGMDSSQRLHLC